MERGWIHKARHRCVKAARNAAACEEQLKIYKEETFRDIGLELLSKKTNCKGHIDLSRSAPTRNETAPIGEERHICVQEQIKNCWRAKQKHQHVKSHARVTNAIL